MNPHSDAHVRDATADDFPAIAAIYAAVYRFSGTFFVQSEHDEFIKPEHADYLARTIPGAKLILLPGVSHFAPLQRPDEFNRVLLAFLGQVLS